MIIIEQHKIIVEDYLSIQLISEEKIVINCKQYVLEIDGTSLMVSGLNKYEIIIKGTFGGLIFHETNA